MKRRRNGDGYVRTAYVGLRLDPVELDLVDYLVQHLNGESDGLLVHTRSSVIRDLINERIDVVLQDTALTKDDIMERIPGAVKRV